VAMSVLRAYGRQHKAHSPGSTWSPQGLLSFQTNEETSVNSMCKILSQATSVSWIQQGQEGLCWPRATGGQLKEAAPPRSPQKPKLVPGDDDTVTPTRAGLKG
jgi:hypothetical protein